MVCINPDEMYFPTSRPNTPVNVIVGGMVLQEILDLTDEEFMDSLLFDIRFQYALSPEYSTEPACYFCQSQIAERRINRNGGRDCRPGA